MGTIFGFLYMRCTLAPSAEYDWTVRVWQWCGLMSNYFDHLLHIKSTHLCNYYYYCIHLMAFFQDNWCKPAPKKVNHSGFYWGKRWWGGSSISWTIGKSFAPRSRHDQASTLPLSFLQAGCPSCCPTDSVKALKANQQQPVEEWKRIQLKHSKNNRYCLSLEQCFTSSSFLICLHCHHNKSSSLIELNYFCVSRYMHTMACSICSTTKQISPTLWRPSFCRTNIAAQDWTIFSVLVSSASNSFHYFCYGST